MNKCECHVWEPIIVLTCLLYVRECFYCGVWHLRDTTVEWEQQDKLDKMIHEYYEDEPPYKRGQN